VGHGARFAVTQDRRIGVRHLEFQGSNKRFFEKPK